MNWTDLIGKVTQGDCLTLLRDIPDKSIDLVLTDPPYGLGSRLHNGGTWGTNPIYDEMLKWDTEKISAEVIQEMLRISKNQIIWGGHLYELPVSRCWLSWEKPKLNTLGDFELAWTSFDSPSKSKYIARNEAGNGSRVHPTQKPVSLFSWCVKDYSKENDIILDPFLGSGTTALACERLNRRWIGFEISQKYCDIAQARIDKERNQLKLAL